MNKFTCILLFCLSCFSVSGDTWLQKASLPSFGRNGACSFSIGTSGYLCGGFGGTTGNCFNDLWEYNSLNNSWTQKADLGNFCRSVAVGFSINGKGYVCGGATTTSDTLNDTNEYDPVSNTWTQKTNMPVGLQEASCFVISNKAYVLFGDSAWITTSCSAEMYEYDPANDVWTVKAPVPGPGRVKAFSFAIGNTGYAGLGTDFGSILDDWYAYDQQNDIWSQKNNLGFNYFRLSGASFSIGNNGYIVGGIGLTSYPKDVLKYNPLNDTWYYKSSFPSDGRSNPIGFVIQDKGYFGTGADSLYTQLTDLWEYTPDSIINDVVDVDKPEFSTFPNPFESTLNIQSATPHGINYKIFDLFGNTVSQGFRPSSNNKLDLSFLNEGSYILTVANQSGTSSRKIVKISEK